MILQNHSKRKGEEAEAKVHWLLTQKGFEVAWPLGDSGTWDLVCIWNNTKINRLQVKSCYSPDKRTANSYYVKVGRGYRSHDGYAAKDFDFLIVVLPWAVFCVPSKVVMGRTGSKKAVTLGFYENGTHRFGKTCEYEKYREAWHLLQ